MKQAEVRKKVGSHDEGRRKLASAKSPQSSTRSKPLKTKQKSARKGTMAEVFSLLEATGSAEVGIAVAEREMAKYCLNAREAHRGAANKFEADLAIHYESQPTRSRLLPSPAFDYGSFGPPSYFESPYIICRLEMLGNTKFLSHLGEELLTVLPQSEANLEYEFFRPGAEPVKTIVEPHQIIRISPSQPHRNRTVGKGKADSWFILRAGNRHVPSIFYEAAEKDNKSDKAKDVIDRLRRLEPHELQRLSDARYLLLASGILEKLRDHRRGSGYQMDELSHLTGLNRFYVQRLQALPFSEDDHTTRDRANFAIDALWRIAVEIDVDLPDMLRNLAWTFHKQGLPEANSQIDGPIPLEAPTQLQHHLLHPEIAYLQPGVPWIEKLNPLSSDMLSVIVMEGELFLESLAADNSSPRDAVNLLKEHKVFHVRRGQAFRCTAKTPTRVLIIRCSDICTCLRQSSAR